MNTVWHKLDLGGVPAEQRFERLIQEGDENALSMIRRPQGEFLVPSQCPLYRVFDHSKHNTSNIGININEELVPVLLQNLVRCDAVVPFDDLGSLTWQMQMHVPYIEREMLKVPIANTNTEVAGDKIGAMTFEIMANRWEFKTDAYVHHFAKRIVKARRSHYERCKKNKGDCASVCSMPVTSEELRWLRATVDATCKW